MGFLLKFLFVYYFVTGKFPKMTDDMFHGLLAIILGLGGFLLFVYWLHTRPVIAYNRSIRFLNKLK